jgi:hypothetical protein
MAAADLRQRLRRAKGKLRKPSQAGAVTRNDGFPAVAPNLTAGKPSLPEVSLPEGAGSSALRASLRRFPIVDSQGEVEEFANRLEPKRQRNYRYCAEAPTAEHVGTRSTVTTTFLLVPRALNQITP